MNRFFKYLFFFMLGGILYNTIEICARGYTHWTMYILGGICFILIGLIPKTFPRAPMLLQMFIGSMTITLLELTTGLIINIGLGWDIWDYSRRILNFKGQICLKHTIFWFGLSFIGIVLNDYLRYWFFGERKPRYRLSRSIR